MKYKQNQFIKASAGSKLQIRPSPQVILQFTFTYK
jgi:hypothetical protein